MTDPTTTASAKAGRTPVRLHLTNIVGLGAVRLMQSLLPALVAQPGYRLEQVYLPNGGELTGLRVFDDATTQSVYKRYLPNSLSRLLECTIFGGNFDGATPLLVFGDIPLRCRGQQTVFVQSRLLLRQERTGRQLGAAKYWIARWLFQRNMKYVKNFIVQTGAMKSQFIESYPEVAGRVHVIAQPAPEWLIDSGIKRVRAERAAGAQLKLFYPAASYPHKNHGLLSRIRAGQEREWSVAELMLTVPAASHPNPRARWIKCVDQLEPAAVMEAYQHADALLFLSLSESFGFPLVEAMWIGLPIICPNLPYARALCGDGARYFDPDDIDSLHAAVVGLQASLDAGWWPDWSENLQQIPISWDEVASSMLRLATGAPGELSG
jgi:glycosyltransferase involved in cell wall biosynthesis